MAREMTEICTSSQLPLGAKGICVERPLMTAIKQDPEHGVRDYLQKMPAQLRKVMAYSLRSPGISAPQS